MSSPCFEFFAAKATGRIPSGQRKTRAQTMHRESVSGPAYAGHKLVRASFISSESSRYEAKYYWIGEKAAGGVEPKENETIAATRVSKLMLLTLSHILCDV